MEVIPIDRASSIEASPILLHNHTGHYMEKEERVNMMGDEQRSLVIFTPSRNALPMNL
jgi:hypothetical protein